MDTTGEYQKEDGQAKMKVLIKELPILFKHHNILVTATYLKTINGNEN